MTNKLWVGSALTPYGNEYGAVVVIAETREEAIALANAKLSLDSGNYVPDQKYAEALLDNIDNIQEHPGGVFVDWDAQRRRR